MEDFRTSYDPKWPQLWGTSMAVTGTEQSLPINVPICRPGISNKNAKQFAGKKEPSYKWCRDSRIFKSKGDNADPYLTPYIKN